MSKIKGDLVPFLKNLAIEASSPQAMYAQLAANEPVCDSELVTAACRAVFASLLLRRGIASLFPPDLTLSNRSLSSHKDLFLEKKIGEYCAMVPTPATE